MGLIVQSNVEFHLFMTTISSVRSKEKVSFVDTTTNNFGVVKLIGYCRFAVRFEYTIIIMDKYHHINSLTFF